MRFGRYSGAWHCVFFDVRRLDRCLGKSVFFYDTADLRDLVELGRADLGTELARHRFAQMIRFGRGRVWLRLSPAQRAALD